MAIWCLLQLMIVVVRGKKKKKKPKTATMLTLSRLFVRTHIHTHICIQDVFDCILKATFCTCPGPQFFTIYLARVQQQHTFMLFLLLLVAANAKAPALKIINNKNNNKSKKQYYILSNFFHSFTISRPTFWLFVLKQNEITTRIHTVKESWKWPESVP